MKSGYDTVDTVHEEGETKSLTNAGIPEMRGSRTTKKQKVMLALGLLVIGFLVGHLTNMHQSGLPGLRMSKEMVAMAGRLAEQDQGCVDECVNHWNHWCQDWHDNPQAAVASCARHYPSMDRKSIALCVNNWNVWCQNWHDNPQEAAASCSSHC